MADSYINPDTQETEWWSPLAFATKTNVSDNPRWHEAMNGPDSRLLGSHEG